MVQRHPNGTQIMPGSGMTGLLIGCYFIELLKSCNTGNISNLSNINNTGNIISVDQVRLYDGGATTDSW